MNEKEKSNRLPSEETRKETSVSSAPVDCYVPESDEHSSPHRVKQELSGRGASDKVILERVKGYHSLFNKKIFKVTFKYIREPANDTAIECVEVSDYIDPEFTKIKRREICLIARNYKEAMDYFDKAFNFRFSRENIERVEELDLELYLLVNGMVKNSDKNAELHNRTLGFLLI